MVSVRTIFEEFQTYLSNAVQTCNLFLITGDFNVHMDIDTDTDRIRMCEVLTVYDLTQHVCVPTHQFGNSLDLIISRCNNELLLSNPVADYMVSDHMFACYQVNMPRRPLKACTISY